MREEGVIGEGVDSKPRPRFSVFRPKMDAAQPGHSIDRHSALAAVQPFFQGMYSYVCSRTPAHEKENACWFTRKLVGVLEHSVLLSVG